MSRPIRRIVPFAAAVATAAALAIPSSASAATTCKLSLKAARSMGPTYVTSVKGDRHPRQRHKCHEGLSELPPEKGKKGSLYDEGPRLLLLGRNGVRRARASRRSSPVT